MRKGWNLIQDEAGWHTYRRCVEESQGWSDKSVNWGSGPLKYPAMVASYSPEPLKIVSAFFYADEATELLHSAGRGVQATAATTATTAPVAPVALASQAEFNRSTSAHLLTLMQTLVEDMKYLTPNQYENRYAANLAHVDRIHAASVDEARQTARRAAGDTGSVVP